MVKYLKTVKKKQVVKTDWDNLSKTSVSQSKTLGYSNNRMKNKTTVENKIVKETMVKFGNDEIIFLRRLYWMCTQKRYNLLVCSEECSCGCFQKCQIFSSVIKHGNHVIVKTQHNAFKENLNLTKTLADNYNNGIELEEKKIFY